MQENNTNKYFIYTRKSSEESSKQVQSLETQERYCFDLAKNNSLHIVDVLKESKSAMDDGNRPVFDLLIEKIKQGEANAIIVVDIDRLARNLVEAGFLYKLMETGILKEIRTLNKTFSDTADLFYMGFEFLRATQYSRDLSEKVKRGVETKLLKGEYPSYAPIGYVNRDKKIFPDPLRASHIKRAFELYATNEYSEKDIVNILYKEGFRTRVANKKVLKSGIHRILTDPVYRGDIRRCGVIYEGIHEPLVSRELFERVQDVLKGKNRAKKRTHKFLYRGYMTCAVCGCKLTATKKGNKYKYYYCTNGKGLCSEHRDYMNESHIETLVSKLFSEIIIDKEMADISLESYGKELLKQGGNYEKIKQNLESQLKNIETKLSNLLDVYIEGNIDKDTYNKKQNDLTSEKLLIKEQLNKLPKESAQTTLEKLRKFKKYCYDLQKLFDNGLDDVKADLLKSVLWKLYIKNKEIASYQYNKPFAWVHSASKKGDFNNWRRVQDSNLWTAINRHGLASRCITALPTLHKDNGNTQILYQLKKVFRSFYSEKNT